MEQIIYNISGGKPKYTASLSPAVVSDQIHLVAGEYSFDNIPDGTYILTVVDNNGCIVINEGIIVSTPTTSTTTSTTTNIPCNQYCYEGIYNIGDEVHPDGGTLVYIDCNGDEQVITEIWIETGIVSINAQSIVSNIGCFPADCTPPTTTTTTTLFPPTTTTTTTGAESVQTMLVARSLGGINHGATYEPCGVSYNDTDYIDIDTLSVVYFLSGTTTPAMSDQLYIDYDLTIPFILSDGTWWSAVTDWNSNTVYDYTVEINAAGVVLSASPCIFYHAEMCVNDTTYDEPNEVNIPYSLDPTIINSPTKAGYNYFFLSIPVGNTFTLLDSLGTDITSTMSVDVASGVGGLDIRPGYFDNYIYKSADTFATDFSTEFTLTIS